MSAKSDEPGTGDSAAERTWLVCTRWIAIAACTREGWNQIAELEPTLRSASPNAISCRALQILRVTPDQHQACQASLARINPVPVQGETHLQPEAQGPVITSSDFGSPEHSVDSVSSDTSFSPPRGATDPPHPKKQRTDYPYNPLNDGYTDSIEHNIGEAQPGSSDTKDAQACKAGLAEDIPKIQRENTADSSALVSAEKSSDSSISPYFHEGSEEETP